MCLLQFKAKDYVELDGSNDPLLLYTCYFAFDTIRVLLGAAKFLASDTKEIVLSLIETVF